MYCPPCGSWPRLFILSDCAFPLLPRSIIGPAPPSNPHTRDQGWHRVYSQATIGHRRRCTTRGDHRYHMGPRAGGTIRPRLGRSCIPCRCALSSGGINRTNECKTGEVSDRSRLATQTHQLPNRPCISRGRGGVSRLSWSSGLAKTTSLAAWAGLAPPAVLITLQIRPRESSGRSSAEGSRSMHAAARSWASHRRHDRVHSGSTLRLRGPSCNGEGPDVRTRDVSCPTLR